MKTVFAYLFSISCLLLFTQACKSSKSPIKVEIIENASPTSKTTSTEMNSTDPITPAAAKAPAERLHRMVHESKMILFELGMTEAFFTAHISLKEMLDEENNKIDSSHEGPFGIKTISAEETMESIVQGRFINYAMDDADYPDVSSIKKPGAMPKPRSTFAADLILKNQRKLEEKTEKSRFILSRFKNIKPTMHLHLSKKDSDRKQLQDAADAKEEHAHGHHEDCHHDEKGERQGNQEQK
jgi:hypothetical protein